MASKEAVVVPVYNEESTCVAVISKILLYFNGIVVVVNDGSRDRTKKILVKNFSNNKRVILLDHKRNKGKGFAMKTGVLSLSKKVEKIVFIDADGQHCPSNLPYFFNQLSSSPIVFGYRDFKGKAFQVRILGSRLIALLVKFFFNIKRKDILCGFFGFTGKMNKKIKWDSSGYEVETEIAAKVGKLKLDFSELEIDTIYTTKRGGIRIIDALKILYKIPVWRFKWQK